MNTQLYLRRKLTNTIVTTFAIGAASFGLLFLAWVLWTLIIRGAGGLNLEVITEMTPPPGADGGLLNPIFGSLVMTGAATLIGTPIGILAGTYMAEYGRYNKLSMVIRFINDVLLSAPSIVIGLFVYEMLVVRMGHFSAWAGIAALSILVMPVVIRTTEDMLNLVPNSLREAATALGRLRCY